MGFELRIERNFDGAPDFVYDAFLAIYDEPLPDWVLTSQRDLRVGGVWHITFKPPGAEAFSEHRIITAADRPNLLQYRATSTSASGQAYDTTVAFATEHVERSVVPPSRSPASPMSLPATSSPPPGPTCSTWSPNTFPARAGCNLPVVAWLCARG